MSRLRIALIAIACLAGAVLFLIAGLTWLDILDLPVQFSIVFAVLAWGIILVAFSFGFDVKGRGYRTTSFNPKTYSPQTEKTLLNTDEMDVTEFIPPDTEIISPGEKFTPPDSFLRLSWLLNGNRYIVEICCFPAVIGRGKGCDVVIQDESLDIHQARIDCVDEDYDVGYTVTNLSPVGSTFVDAVYAENSIHLTRGCEVKLGKIEITADPIYTSALVR